MGEAGQLGLDYKANKFRLALLMISTSSSSWVDLDSPEMAPLIEW